MIKFFTKSQHQINQMKVVSSLTINYNHFISVSGESSKCRLDSFFTMNLQTQLILFVFLLFCVLDEASTFLDELVPECAGNALHYGASLGAMAGGMSGAAIFTGTGLGGATLAACPTMATSTIIGTGGAILGGPLVPVGGFLVGALFGGLAGGTTGGWIQCQKDTEQELARATQFYIQHHPDGDTLKQLQSMTRNYLQVPQIIRPSRHPYSHSTPKEHYKPPILRQSTFVAKPTYVSNEVKHVERNSADDDFIRRKDFILMMKLLNRENQLNQMEKKNSNQITDSQRERETPFPDAEMYQPLNEESEETEDAIQSEIRIIPRAQPKNVFRLFDLNQQASKRRIGDHFIRSYPRYYPHVYPRILHK